MDAIENLNIMKKLPLLLLLGLLTTACRTYQTTQTLNSFDNNITFKISKVVEAYSAHQGGLTYQPGRGKKYVYLYITFENHAAERKTLNFENVFLLDVKNKTKYKVDFSIITGPILISDDSEISIGVNKSKERALVFTYPDDIKPEYISVNDQIIKIDYKS